MSLDGLSVSQQVWALLEQDIEQAARFVDENKTLLLQDKGGRRAALEAWWRRREDEKIVQIGMAVSQDNPNDLEIATSLANAFAATGDRAGAIAVMARCGAPSIYKDDPAVIWAILIMINIGCVSLARNLFELVHPNRETYRDTIQSGVLDLIYYLFSLPNSVVESPLDPTREAKPSAVQTLQPDADVLVLDLAMSGEIGHGQMFAQFLLASAQERLSVPVSRVDYHGGTDLRSNPALSAIVAQEVRPSLNITPWFFRRQPAYPETLAAFNEVTYQRMVQTFGGLPEISAPIVIYPYTLPGDLLGFANWFVQGSFPETGVTLVIGLLFNDFLSDPPAERQVAIDVLKSAITLLQQHPKITLTVFSEVDAINALVADFGVAEEQIFLLPFLPSLRFEGGSSVGKLARPERRIGSVGTCRPSRGHHHIFDAADYLDGSNVELFVQAREASFSTFDAQYAEREETLQDQVTRLVADRKIIWEPDPLDQMAYDAALLSLDAVILPYDPAFYKDTGSGVAFEAVAARRHLILSSQCAFAGILARVGYPHTLIHELSGRGVAEAIERALYNAPVLDDALARWDNADLLMSEVERFFETLRRAVS